MHLFILNSIFIWKYLNFYFLNQKHFEWPFQNTALKNFKLLIFDKIQNHQFILIVKKWDQNLCSPLAWILNCRSAEDQAEPEQTGCASGRQRSDHLRGDGRAAHHHHLGATARAHAALGANLQRTAAVPGHRRLGRRQIRLQGHQQGRICRSLRRGHCRRYGDLNFLLA